jgi:hypothetical protein
VEILSQFQMDSQVKEAIEILKQNTQKKLYLNRCCNNLYFLLLFLGIGDEGTIELSEYLKSNSSLQKLYLVGMSNQNFK